jgi:putrescine oxidase
VAGESIETGVVVIGAGIAGLTAANRLVDAGVEVVVLEARDRVGGRTWNTEIEGEANELGGQWVGPYQEAVLETLELLGLETFPSYRTGSHAYIDPDGRVHRFEGEEFPFPPQTAAAYEAALARLDELAGEMDPGAPWDHPQAEALDSVTFESWLAAEVSDGMARDMLRAMLAGGFIAKPAQSFSVLQGLWMIAGAGGTYELFEPEQCLASRVVGGSQLIAIGLADRLGDRVRLGAPVSTLEWADGGVVATAPGVSVAADRAIVAVPPNMTNAIRFEPPLPGWRQRLAQDLSQGSIIKVLAVYEEPFWRLDGLSGQGFGPYELVRELYDNSPPSGRPGVLVTFLAGESAEAGARMDPTDRRAAVLEGMARYVGGEALNPIDYIEVDWSEQEWTRGAYGTSYGTGGLTRFRDDLRRPVGPIEWACSDIAGVGHIHMEGAIRMGRRAARACLEAPA